jgi:serine protease Do
MKRILFAAVVVAAAIPAPAAFASAPITDELRRSAVVEAVEKAGPAVVNIGTERIILVRRDPLWELFGDLTPDDSYRTERYKAYSLGSGVIIDPDGYIVTNEHVIRRASDIHVSLAHSEKVYKAELIASDPSHDVAVIKIDPDAPLPHVEFADSDALMIGETAIAIGNPFGLESTVTTGVVSALRRSIVRDDQVIFEDFLQTDAAINPGNSGGALVDIHGRLIGINTAMQYGAENIGFAIPVNKVKQSLEMLLDPRQLKQMWVGVVIDDHEPGRCVVTSVDAGSPADKAGLKTGDVIVGLDELTTCGAFEYDLYLLKKNVGDTVTFTVERGGGQKKLPLTLVAAPRPSGADLARTLFGLDVRDLTAGDTAGLEVELKGGVIVTGVEDRGPAADKQLRKGDVIVRVGSYSVPNTEHLGTLLEQVKRGDNVLFMVVRGEYLIGNILTAR